MFTFKQQNYHKSRSLSSIFVLPARNGKSLNWLLTSILLLFVKTILVCKTEFGLMNKSSFSTLVQNNDIAGNGTQLRRIIYCFGVWQTTRSLGTLWDCWDRTRIVGSLCNATGWNVEQQDWTNTRTISFEKWFVCSFAEGARWAYEECHPH